MGLTTLLIKKFLSLSTLVLSLLCVGTPRALADKGDLGTCEVNLTGVAGNLIKQGLREIQRHHVLALPSRSLEAGDGITTGPHAVYYLLLVRDENLRKLHYRMVVDQQRVEGEESGPKTYRPLDTAQLQFSVDEKEWSPAIHLRRLDKSYEDKVNAGIKIDTYFGKVKTFGVETSISVVLNYVPKESDDSASEGWPSTGSALVRSY